MTKPLPDHVLVYLLTFVGCAALSAGVLLVGMEKAVAGSSKDPSTKLPMTAKLENRSDTKSWTGVIAIMVGKTIAGSLIKDCSPSVNEKSLVE